MPPHGTMHQHLAEVLRSATDQILGRMLGFTTQPRMAYRNPVAAFSTNGVVSLIGVNGAWAGTASLSCNARLACHLASRLLLSTYETVNDDVLEAVAQVSNEVMGCVKTSLEDYLGPVTLGIPTVIYSRHFKSRSPAGQLWSIVPCFIGRELLEVQLCLSKTYAGSTTRLTIGDAGSSVSASRRESESPSALR